MEDLENRTGEWPGGEVVDVLGAWLADFVFTGVSAPARWVAGSAWMLRRQDRQEDVVTLWADEASALASLAQHARASWDNVRGGEGIPDSPPAHDRRAVDLYHGPKGERGDESYWLHADDIGGSPPPCLRRTASSSRARSSAPRPTALPSSTR
ncbi:hypothetical protein ACWGIA_23700 [Streptomyces bobili]